MERNRSFSLYPSGVKGKAHLPPLGVKGGRASNAGPALEGRAVGIGTDYGVTGEHAIKNFDDELNKNKFNNYMAKKSMIQRELKRQRLVMKYAKKREDLKKQIKESSTLKQKLILHRKLQQLPRNSSSVRLHNRCMITGRPKGYYRDFGLSRHVLREMAHQGLLPGVQKSSW